MCLAQGTQRCDASEAQTRGPSVSSQALYHCATALPANEDMISSGLEVIKLFPSSTMLNKKFIMLINVKMPTVVGILTFIRMINATYERL